MYNFYHKLGEGIFRNKSKKYPLTFKAVLYYGFGRYVYAISLDRGEEGIIHYPVKDIETMEDYELRMMFSEFGFQNLDIARIHIKLVLRKWIRKFEISDAYSFGMVDSLNFKIK